MVQNNYDHLWTHYLFWTICFGPFVLDYLFWTICFGPIKTYSIRWFFVGKGKRSQWTILICVILGCFSIWNDTDWIWRYSNNHSYTVVPISSCTCHIRRRIETDCVCNISFIFISFHLYLCFSLSMALAISMLQSCFSISSLIRLFCYHGRPFADPAFAFSTLPCSCSPCTQLTYAYHCLVKS